MPGVRRRGEEIRAFILNNISNHRNIAAVTSQRFGISLPAVYKHIDRLVSENQLVKEGNRFALQYTSHNYMYRNDAALSEDAVWEKDIKKHFSGVLPNVRHIWIYGFLEMFNNAIEHSGAQKIRVEIRENKVLTCLTVSDNGIGIFNKIKTKFNLIDEKDAVLELAKGKRSTDTTRHSGQGIFFTSKIFDNFVIKSNGITFDTGRGENGHLAGKHKFSTLVCMCLANNSNKILENVFDEFSTEIPGDFDKTIVPVHLANSSDLVSRSQARRVLGGLELFREVILDFNGVEYIGQAFADEIFRVFAAMNTGTVIIAQNANAGIQSMINRAVNTKL